MGYRQASSEEYKRSEEGFWWEDEHNRGLWDKMGGGQDLDRWSNHKVHKNNNNKSDITWKSYRTLTLYWRNATLTIVAFHSDTPSAPSQLSVPSLPWSVFCFFSVIYPSPDFTFYTTTPSFKNFRSFKTNII